METINLLLKISSYRIGLTILITLLSNVVRAQNLYEVIWHSDDIEYTGLLVYYHDDDAFMRVHYINSYGEFIVAEFSCYGHEDHFNGEDYFLLDGSIASVVYPVDNTGYTYNADNFIFKNTDLYGNAESVYTIDDSQLNAWNWTDYLKKVDSWREITAKDLNISYVRSFFEPTEYYYDYLLSKHSQNQTIPHTIFMKLQD